MFTKEMMKALEQDGEKLRQLTGEDHGPVFLSDGCEHVFEVDGPAPGRCTFCGYRPDSK